MTATTSTNAAATAERSSSGAATTSKLSGKQRAGAVTRCPACGRKYKRSTQANARLWLLYHLIADKVTPNGQRYSAEQFHIYFKSRFLGCDDVKMPNGKTLVIPRSSADLDTAEFNEFMEKIEAWAAEREIYLEDMEGAA